MKLYPLALLVIGPLSSWFAYLHADDKTPAPVASIVTLPDVAAIPGELTLVDVSSVDADAVTWETLGQAPKNVLPQYKPGSMTPYGLAFATNSQGTWYIVGAGVKGKIPFVVRCTVTVGKAPPPPPPPPPPPINPPPPAGTFERAVWDASAADADPANVAKLASFFGAAPAALDNRADVNSNESLHTWIVNGLKAFPHGVIPKTEAAVIAELKTAFPAGGTWDGAKAKAELFKIAAALKGVAP